MDMANLRGFDDELALLQLSTSKVYLLDENYRVTKALPNIEDRHKIDRVFVIVSAIKSAICDSQGTQKMVATRRTARCNNLIQFIFVF